MVETAGLVPGGFVFAASFRKSGFPFGPMLYRCDDRAQLP
jgi:hypothetical protein